jgi:hypothetical protein
VKQKGRPGAAQAYFVVVSGYGSLGETQLATAETRNRGFKAKERY